MPLVCFKLKLLIWSLRNTPSTSAAVRRFQFFPVLRTAFLVRWVRIAPDISSEGMWPIVWFDSTDTINAHWQAKRARRAERQAPGIRATAANILTLSLASSVFLQAGSWRYFDLIEMGSRQKGRRVLMTFFRLRPASEHRTDSSSCVCYLCFYL